MNVGVAVILAVCLLVVVVVWFARTWPLGRRGRARPREDALYRQLLGKVLGDRQVAERLIRYERERDPSTSNPELVERAIRRLDRDRR